MKVAWLAAVAESSQSHHHYPIGIKHILPAAAAAIVQAAILERVDGLTQRTATLEEAAKQLQHKATQVRLLSQAATASRTRHATAAAAAAASWLGLMNPA